MVTATAAVLGAVLLVGCSSDDHVDASQAGKDLPDCSDTACAAEVAAYSDAVAVLPGVRKVDLSYRAEQTTDGASVDGDVMVTADTVCADLEDELGRLLWQSPINPVISVELQCYLPGASGSDYEDTRYAFVLKDAADLTEQWGPRGG